MASGLTKWIAVVVLACAGLAAWLLPPTGEWLVDFSFTLREPTPERERERELSRAVTETKTLLARRYFADRFRDALDRERGGRLAVIALDEPAEAPAEVREGWRRQIEAAVRARPLGEGGMDVAVFLLGREHELPGGYEAREESATEYYLLDRPSGPVCVVAVFPPTPTRMHEQWWAEDERRGRLAEGVLGPCAFYATHGPPGTRVAEWLEGGAYLFADRAVPFDVAPGEEIAERRGLFGMRGRTTESVPPGHEACLAGHAEICATFLLDPKDVDRGFLRYGPYTSIAQRTELLYSEYRWRKPPDAHLLADLEAEFGAERFGRFWRSPAPVAQAFEEAFGESPGQWTRRWAVARFGEEESGPGLGLLTAVLSVLTLGATFLVSAYVADRRSVG